MCGTILVNLFHTINFKSIVRARWGKVPLIGINDYCTGEIGTEARRLPADDFPTVESLAEAADLKLFVSIAGNPHYVLRRSYHEKESSGHHLRIQVHNFLLPDKDERNFVSRSIYAELKA